MPDSTSTVSTVPRARSIQTRQRAGKKICIDCGSTQTRVSIDAALVWQQPSCMVMHEASQSLVTIGNAAYQLLGKHNKGTEMVFPVEYGAISSVEHAVAFLRSLREELSIGNSVLGMLDGILHAHTLIALQDAGSPLEKKQFQHVWSEAGWQGVNFVSAPRAILVANKLALSDQPQCVIDLGGHVSFLSIVQGESVIASERINWGGLNLTDAIQRVVREQRHCAISWHTAEKIKRELAHVSIADAPRTKRQAKLSVTGKDLSSQLGKSVVVEGEEILGVIERYPQLLITQIQHFFADISAEIISSCLEQGIVLSGGSAQLSGIAEYVQQSLKTEVVVSQHPELDLLLGMQHSAGVKN